MVEGVGMLPATLRVNLADMIWREPWVCDRWNLLTKGVRHENLARS